MKKMFALTAAAALGIVMAGCSSQEPAEPVTASHDAIVEAIGDSYDMDGFVDFGGERCEYAVVIPNRGLVEMFEEAGDTVATNPTGDFGVKVVGYNSDDCMEPFAEALEEVETSPASSRGTSARSY